MLSLMLERLLAIAKRQDTSTATKIRKIVSAYAQIRREVEEATEGTMIGIPAHLVREYAEKHAQLRSLAHQFLKSDDVT